MVRFLGWDIYQILVKNFRFLVNRSQNNFVISNSWWFLGRNYNIDPPCLPDRQVRESGKRVNF
jgi:hypothetical protein